ncbi:DNA-binding protein [Candidatus Roizmanbacteria bacterium CG_4_9_14_3_um_filter_33_18]|uniref:DNA-binding protein n=1 Tax=Candidatus Roizmanbacteria bacterium CG_4_9_14_3_um_filter_33_18 TaxID=1974841 RepID=A0A2M7XYC2_9BACT|nr:MAG: DNA-binding protein [Candidatus Roizmanbacteria bacterium CG_4_9_14_3_um_filter_33_18]
MSNEKMIKNWLLKAENDIATANDLYKSKHYDWCLFIWHLAIEKALKAKISSLKKEYLYTHKLVKLAELAEFPINKKVLEQLREITSYNIEARYDDYKLSFYKKATKEYTSKWVIICEDIFKIIIKTI